QIRKLPGDLKDRVREAEVLPSFHKHVVIEKALLLAPIDRQAGFALANKQKRTGQNARRTGILHCDPARCNRAIGLDCAVEIDECTDGEAGKTVDALIYSGSAR